MRIKAKPPYIMEAQNQSNSIEDIAEKITDRNTSATAFTNIFYSWLMAIVICNFQFSKGDQISSKSKADHFITVANGWLEYLCRQRLTPDLVS